MGNTFLLKISVNRDCELLCVREFFFYLHSLQLLHCHLALKISIYLLFPGRKKFI